jgi:nucleotide-binding universal stress UspA family protein
MNGVRYAAKFAHHAGASLTLLNIQSLMQLTPEEALAGVKLNVQAAKARLEELSQEVGRMFKINCRDIVIPSISSISSIISQEGESFDLIVMGSNGPDDINQYLAGSNAYRAIRSSSTPLLIIPEDCIYSELKKIVFAFDYWRRNILPVEQLLSLAKLFDSEIIVLQLMEESYSQEAEAEINEFQKVFSQLHHKERMSYDTVYTSSPTDAVHDYVLDHGADMVALCAVQRGFLTRLFRKSVIKGISAMATYPLYVFHQ